MTITRLHCEDSFFQSAQQMRSFFLKQYENPYEAHEKRFVWDKWNIENQYCFLRTPAYHYFPQELYGEFQTHLTDWGRQNLGCTTVSPPWLSLYLDGDFQNFHSDSPHGPWAYVFSLSDDSFFAGGETQLFRDEILDYWTSFQSKKAMEAVNFIEKISPTFNRLLVFDPRIPHGVSPIKGSQDPQKGRLVVHGWFTQPAPQVSGGLEQVDFSETLNQQISKLFGELQLDADLQGVISFELKINENGQVDEIKNMTNALRMLAAGGQYDTEVLYQIQDRLQHFQFQGSSSSSQLILPFVFEPRDEE